MKSLGGGICITLGAPFFLAFALLKLLSPSSGSSLGDFLFAGSVLWFFVALLVLVPAVPRVALGRRWNLWPVEQDWVWRKRQRATVREGLKAAAAGMAAFGLVLWVNHSFISSTPTHHDARIFVGAGITSLDVGIPRPKPDDCPSAGAIVVSHHGNGALRLSVGGVVRQPLWRGPHRSRYRVPLSSERSTYSCYYDFPEVISARGSVPVRLSVAALGSAADSTPAPTHFHAGYWGWRCEARPRGGGCAVLAVLNADPASAAPSLALLVAGGGFAAVISLLVSVLLALWRGWVADLMNVWRMLKKVAMILWSELRPPPPETTDH